MKLFIGVLCSLCVCFEVVDNVNSELYFIPEVESNFKMKTTIETVPWMGILRVKHDLVKTEFASVVILIAKHYAIGCADDISKIEKNTLNTSTTVTFYNKHLVPWNTIVTDYSVHPEYGDETINTIAVLQLDSENKVPSFMYYSVHPEYGDDTINTIGVLKLDSENKVPSFMWQPVKWPTEFYSPRNQSSVFNIGFTDKKSVLEQVINKVEYVNQRKCIKFYKKEGMDFKTIWPTNYKCFKVVGDNETCVYDAGMAVASNYTRRWTLIGIGTYGPGCSLPARFIEFFPYIPWIESIIETTKKYDEVEYRRSPWKKNEGEDLDTKLLAILYNYTIDLYPQVPQETIWSKTNDCPGKNRIVYQEQGKFKLTAPIPTATVLYALSLFDDNYEDLHCIRIVLDCVQKSKTQVFVQRGFGQEDLEPLIKQPMKPTLGKYIAEGFKYPDKILFLTGDYKDFRNKTVTTVWFKFIFFRTGKFLVTFFSKKKIFTTSTEKSTSTAVPTTTPMRRPHDIFLEWSVYKDGQTG